eukprot:2763529-Amphidinium_carterae.1
MGKKTLVAGKPQSLLSFGGKSEKSAVGGGGGGTSSSAITPVKKQQSGVCKCSACGAWSKDCHCPHLDTQTCSSTLDKVWALRRSNPRTGAEVAEGDSCEQCHMEWKSHFSHITWDEFTSYKVDPNHEVHQFLEDAKRCSMQPSLKTWLAQEVLHAQGCCLTLQKSFIALTS